MNTIYIVRMMDECVRTFNSETSKRVCDLVPSKTLILFLSTSATRRLMLGPRDAGFAQASRLRFDAGTLTSAAMLGYKVAHAEVIKFAMDENERLKQERAELLGELEASLSPETALQVERIIDRRSSFMPDVVLTPRPKPAHRDDVEAEEAPGSARLGEVRRQHGHSHSLTHSLRASRWFASSGLGVQVRAPTDVVAPLVGASGKQAATQVRARCGVHALGACKPSVASTIAHGTCAGIGRGSDTRTSRG